MTTQDPRAAGRPDRSWDAYREIVRSPDGHEQHQADESAWARKPASGSGGDLIEIGGNLTLWPWRGGRGTTVGFALVALVAGLLLGFAAGHLTGRTSRTPPKTAAKSITVVPLEGTGQIFFTGNRCAVQHGRMLQLGIEIDNRSGNTVTVDQIRSVLPLGGLRQVSSELATCGSLSLPGEAPLTTIANDASAWLTVNFAVTAKCPAPNPVLFVISYAALGKPASMYFNGFPDLSLVPYTGCRAR